MYEPQAQSSSWEENKSKEELVRENKKGKPERGWNGGAHLGMLVGSTQDAGSSLWFLSEERCSVTTSGHIGRAGRGYQVSHSASGVMASPANQEGELQKAILGAVTAKQGQPVARKPGRVWASTSTFA